MHVLLILPCYMTVDDTTCIAWGFLRLKMSSTISSFVL